MLTEYDRDLPADQLEAVRDWYEQELGPATQTGGGSASPKVVLGQGPPRFLLKRRRREFSDREVVRFDHGVMRYLSERGLPVYPPISTKDGQSAVWLDGWAFELFPFVEGLQRFDISDDEQLRQAASLLGEFHAVSRNFTPPGRKDWQREFHMGRNIRTLEDFLEDSAAKRGESREIAEAMLVAARKVAIELNDLVYATLPTAIIHGDYTWANLASRAGRVAALFDFDWTYRQARLDDVARALLFLAFPRDPDPGGDDIWTLVAPFTLDLNRAALFLDVYERTGERLNALERRLLPWYVRECWLCCRIRAMRKVAIELKLEILTFGMAPILDLWNELDRLADR